MADVRDIFAKPLGVVHIGKAHVERQFEPLGLGKRRELPNAASRGWTWRHPTPPRPLPHRVLRLRRRKEELEDAEEAAEHWPDELGIAQHKGTT